jgi:PqqD family protein of HPr-rel-A system
MSVELEPRWHIAPGQRLIFADFDDGIVMFDAKIGGTHLLNVTAAEALAIIEESPALTASAIHSRVLERMQLSGGALPFPALVELLWRLEDLNLIAAFAE